MEVEPLAERILLDLCNTFKKDPLIDEFDIIPVEDSVWNKSPVVHVQHKVALESWCVKHVYVYAYRKLFDWKQHKYKTDFSVLLSWTSLVLLINPDVQTAWNIRKELVSSKLYGAEEELKFSEIVLSHKPKSPEGFAHRKWALLELIGNTSNHSSTASVIEHEFMVCTQVAARYPNNYHAWCHRMWVIQNILKYCLKAVDRELEETENWVSTHVSDHSGFQYRQFLINSISAQLNFQQCSLVTCPFHSSSSRTLDVKTECRSDRLNYALGRELILITDLILSFPGHETLWNHRRFVIFYIMKVSKSKEMKFTLPTPTTNCIVSDDQMYSKKYKLEACSAACCIWSLAEEEKFINQCSKGNRCSEWEKEIIARYITWLKKVTFSSVAHNSESREHEFKNI